MKVAGRRGHSWFLSLEPGERLEDALLAIARASFETAAPAGISIVDYDPADLWEDVKSQITLNLSAAVGEPVLLLDYLDGRRCKSQVMRGRKCMRFYAGDGREQEAKRILEVAMKGLLIAAISKTLQ